MRDTISVLSPNKTNISDGWLKIHSKSSDITKLVEFLLLCGEMVEDSWGQGSILARFTGLPDHIKHHTFRKLCVGLYPFRIFPLDFHPVQALLSRI